MKSIQPIQIWINGNNITANTLSLTLVNDNLKDKAVFNYQLFNQYIDVNNMTQLELVVDNNIVIEGVDYSNWNGGNNEAYTLCATKLNLTIV